MAISFFLSGCIEDDHLPMNAQTSVMASPFITGGFFNGGNISIGFNVSLPPSIPSLRLTLIVEIKDPDGNLQVPSSSGVIRDTEVIKVEYLCLYIGEYIISARIEEMPFLNFSRTIKVHPYMKNINGNMMYPNKWAVLIGIADYPDGGPADLTGSWNETRSIYEFLTKKYGFPTHHILLLLNETAKHKDILDALEWLANNTDGKSTVVVHYNGHGAIGVIESNHDNIRESNICPYDKASAGVIWSSEIRPIVDKMKYEKLLMFFGGCVAGGFSGNDHGMVGGDVPFFEDLGGPNRIIITSSSSFTESQYLGPPYGWEVFAYLFWKEGLYEDKGDENLIHSDRDKKPSVEEAWWYAKTKIIDVAFPHAIITLTQIPTMNDGYDGDMYL